MARKYFDAPREKLLQAVRAGANAKYAADFAGIHASTVRRWRAKEPDFAAAWSRAEEEALDAFEALCRAQAAELDWSEISFVTPRRHFDQEDHDARGE